MKNRNLALILVLFSTLMTSYAMGQDQHTAVISLKTERNLPTDLVDESGRKLSFQDLDALFRQTGDLSKLNPIENKFWQNKKYDAIDTALHEQMPTAEDGVVAKAEALGSVPALGLVTIKVMTAKSPQKNYSLTFGLDTHSSLLKAALLRKIGYYQMSPRYYQSIQVKFSDVKSMKNFINEAFCPDNTDDINPSCLFVDPIKRGFITDINESAATLKIHGAYLEAQDANVISFFDGLAPSSGSGPEQGERTFRALLIPFVIGDLGESINRYSINPFAVVGDVARVNYFDADYFSQTSGSDARWILRRMAQLTDADWHDIAEASSLPQQYRPLVESKLKINFRNSMRNFFSKTEFDSLYRLNSIPKLSSINSDDGSVKQGIVTLEKTPGYPQRFSHGPRQSPFESGDFLRFLKVKAQSDTFGWVIDQLVTKVNKAEFQPHVLDQKINGIEVGPSGVRPLVTASVLQGGVQANGARMITTGTFYGSSAPVQMVDTVSIGASIGYGRFAEALSGITSVRGANLSYVRNFTHVRPVTSMKDAAKIKFEEVITNFRIKSIASPLKTGKLSEFLSQLQNNEVFTITDSIAVNGQLSWKTGLSALIGIGSVAPTLGVSADAGTVNLRQIQFTRTDAGLQIFIRNNNQKMFGVGLDVDYYINLLKLQTQTTYSDYKTDIFQLNFNADEVSRLEKLSQDAAKDPTTVISDEDQVKIKANNNLTRILKALILRSNVDPIYQKGIPFEQRDGNIDQYHVDHQLKTKEAKAKFLWLRSSRMKEQHILGIRKEDIPKVVDNVAVQNPTIQIVSNRQGELVGRDKFGFALNLLDGFIQNKFANAPTLSVESQNPSTMPYGQAQWKMVRTDSEFTSPQRTGQLPTVSIIEHVWGGWSLKKPQLDQILQSVKAETDKIEMSSGPILPDEAFYQVKKVDFFRVTSHLSLLPSAVDRIKQLMAVDEIANKVQDESAPIQTVEKQKIKKSLWARLKNVFSSRKRPEDKVVYDKILELVGDGDKQAGYDQCRINQAQAQQQNESTAYVLNTTVYYKGQRYECIEPWIERLIKLSRSFPQNDIVKQNQWMTKVLYVLDEKIPQAYFLNYLGEKNFIYYLDVVGFRSGDEDGDDGEQISKVYGNPGGKDSVYANGLISVLAIKSGILPIELDRSEGSFQ